MKVDVYSLIVSANSDSVSGPRSDEGELFADNRFVQEIVVRVAVRARAILLSVVPMLAESGGEAFGIANRRFEALRAIRC